MSSLTNKNEIDWSDLLAGDGGSEQLNKIREKATSEIGNLLPKLNEMLDREDITVTEIVSIAKIMKDLAALGQSKKFSVKNRSGVNISVLINPSDWTIDDQDHTTPVHMPSYSMGANSVDSRICTGTGDNNCGLQGAEKQLKNLLSGKSTGYKQPQRNTSVSGEKDASQIKSSEEMSKAEKAAEDIMNDSGFVEEF